MTEDRFAEQKEVLGHPAGLYTLFFAEMWERFSYYGMRALLVLYLLKGFLGYGDKDAYAIYGSYTALVYMTPFIGGYLADKFLGQRIAVVIGGVLMAAGHLLMTVQSEWPFFFALALLICGNGFFKPNISTTVGTLYRPGSPKRDDGFNIFYMGINLGAAMSPLLCGYIGETYGWHYGFGLATIGMLAGLAVFVMPTRVTQLIVGAAALAAAIGMLVFRPDNAWATAFNVFVAASLVIAAVIACMALQKEGLPKWAGQRPENAPKNKDWMIYGGIAVAIPLFAVLVSGWSPLRREEVPEPVIATLKARGVSADVVADVQSGHFNAPKARKAMKDAGVDEETIEEALKRGEPFSIISEERIVAIKTGVSSEMFEEIKGKGVGDDVIGSIKKGCVTEETTKALQAAGVTGSTIEKVKAGGGSSGSVFATFAEEVSKPAGLILAILGTLAFGYLFAQSLRLQKVPRQRMFAAFALIFGNLLFFALFEQAGSSTTNFTDRNVDRVGENSTVTADMVGQTIKLQPTQEQLGYELNGKVFTLSDLDALRESPPSPDFTIDWTISQQNVGMGIAKRADELPASIFQAVNPVGILLFALVFNLLWSYLRRYGFEPSAPLKFALGLIQLGLGFLAYWFGAETANDRGMVSVIWLLLGYVLHTTGELCLSPVGLSAMTKLAPRFLVSTLMGAWFLATAFSQYLAGIISQFMRIHQCGSGKGVPAPKFTVDVYGGVFYKLGVIIIVVGVVSVLLSPFIKRWMHEDTMADDS